MSSDDFLAAVDAQSQSFGWVPYLRGHALKRSSHPEVDDFDRRTQHVRVAMLRRSPWIARVKSTWHPLLTHPGPDEKEGSKKKTIANSNKPKDKGWEEGSVS